MNQVTLFLQAIKLGLIVIILLSIIAFFSYFIFISRQNVSLKYSADKMKQNATTQGLILEDVVLQLKKKKKHRKKYLKKTQIEKKIKNVDPSKFFNCELENFNNIDYEC